MTISNLKKSCIGLMLFFITGLAHAQLVANDDVFGVPYYPFGGFLQVEALGVLKNDTLNGETDQGLTAANITDPDTGDLLNLPSYGTLRCLTNPDYDPDVEIPIYEPGVCSDGSFEYLSGSSFTGTDSFTYQVFDGTTPGNIATVTLTACVVEATDPDTGEATLYSCWIESVYRAKLAQLGYGTFLEGFEGAVWDDVRTTQGSPNSAQFITSQGITWTSNHPDPPAENPITTSSGAAVTGAWGLYDPDHGYAVEEGNVDYCNSDTTPEPVPDDCLYHDGFRGAIQSGGASLHGVGGYIHATGGGNIDIILDGDGANPITFGQLSGSSYQFFGVIDATVPGFSGFEFQEQDGKVGQERFIFGDDFIIASSGQLPGNTPPTQPGTLLASAITDNSATVSWGASTDVDPADIITYLVEYRRNGDLPWTSGGTTTTTSQALTGLDSAQSYDVQVTPNDGTDDGTARTTLNLFQTLAADDFIFSDSFEGNP